LWTRSAGASLLHMDTEPRRLGLEVRFDSQPIEGRVYDQADHDALDRRFSGWLGLISAIEAARLAAPPLDRKGEKR
jgi:hypothetical protein